MLRRSTIVALLVLLVLVGLAYYLQGPGKKAAVEATPTQSSQFLFSFNSEITRLSISKPGANSVEMSKDPQGDWKLINPSTEATDSSQIQSAVTQLMSLRSSANLDMAPSLDSAGLSVPSYTVIITLADGSQEVINVGKETPTKGNYYIQIGNKGIFIVNKYSLDPLLKFVDSPPIIPSPTPTETTPPSADGTETPETDSATPVP